MRLGFIGVGNMGGAVIKGYIASGAGDAKSVTAFDKDADKLSAFATETGVAAAKSVAALADLSDTIILAVKPNNFEEVLPELARSLTDDKLVISMAAGISIAYIAGFLGDGAKLIRIMPNTPAMVGAGMTAVSRNARVGDAEFDRAIELFRSVGRAEPVDESLMDAVTGVSGSSPAYVYMFIDALTKGAAENGMDETQARTFAAQAVLGAAKMVLETGIDPLTLRQNVCSPGGTTIEAVNVLLGNGFENTVMEGMRACVEKSKRLAK
ncbi:MAG: pyrroline-5-carboxylate reductase [Clostridiales Family XIII bacterium]|jgi:pyrroline-5-carboxylate reductase|nr:pyrroline-5-carboxylate reductase [Clostridiales Family XIII bacterium]